MRADAAYCMAMRATFVAAMMSSSIVHASPTVDVVTGISIPLHDDAWTRDADLGVLLGARANFGVVFTTLAWKYVVQDRRYDRLDAGRALVGVVGRRRFGQFTIESRAALGLDTLRATSTVRGTRGTDWDTGMAFEVAADIWMPLGGGALGIDLGIPVAVHSTRLGADDPSQSIPSYVTVDLAAVLFVRLGH